LRRSTDRFYERRFGHDSAMFACPVPPPVQPPWPQRPRYELAVRVRPGYRRVDGRLSVRFTPNRDTGRIVFRLWPNGPHQLAEGARLTVGTPVTDAGRRLPARRHDPTTLTLRTPLRAGQSITVRLPWHLRVPRTGTDRIARFRNGVRLGSFFPILPWDPRRGWVTDPPARILAETSTSPVSDFDVRVTAPAGARVLASGSEVGPGHWHATAVRDFALAAGRFKVVTGRARAPNPVTVRVAVAGGAQVPRDVLALTVRTLHKLARRYGPYPWSSYTVVATPDLGAEGIEYPTLVYIGAASIVTLLVQHESAHQWFYSLVGNDQAHDPWLDEALATWSQIRLSGGSVFDYRAVGPAHHVGAPVSFFGTNTVEYFRQVYGGGVAALASLRADAKVDCALKLYAARAAFRIAQPRDLLDALDRVIPGASDRLRRFGIHR
jgi:Peptidase family M1 domain